MSSGTPAICTRGSCVGPVSSPSTKGPDQNNALWGGTAANGEREFTYNAKSHLGAAASHASLLDPGFQGIMKITLIEPILNFTGSTQESSYGTDVTSRSLDRTQLPNGETYGYRLERYVDPFGN